MSDAEIANVLNALWGCVVDEYRFDLANHTVSFHLNCTEGGETRRALVEMVGVLTIVLDNSFFFRAPGYLSKPWAYVELTAIEATRVQVSGHEFWRITAELWESKFEVICQNVLARVLS